MKKILLMSALSIAVFGTMNAQNAATASTTTVAQKQSPHVRAKTMVAKITSVSQLQGDQIGKVNQLYVEYFTKVDALGANATPAQLKELNAGVDAQLKGTLTPAQYKFWQEASNK